MVGTYNYAPSEKNVKKCAPYEGIFEGGYRHSASGLGVRWVVAIDSTRVRVPARALLFFVERGARL